MINSKIIVSTINYVVNDLTTKNCNTLLDMINNKLSSKELLNELNIIFIDNTYDVRIVKNSISINITSYITRNDTDSVIKKLRTFIDNNLTTIKQDNFTATMIMRRVY